MKCVSSGNSTIDRNIVHYQLLLSPVSAKFILSKMLASRADRPLQLSFEYQFKALIFYHLQEFSSGREFIQAFELNDFAKECVSPPKGIQKNVFFEAINTRGLDQLLEIFEDLVQQAGSILPAHIGIKFLLPFLSDRCLVISDISTTLLTAKWLRPDLSVIAIVVDKAFYEQLTHLL